MITWITIKSKQAAFSSQSGHHSSWSEGENPLTREKLPRMNFTGLQFCSLCRLPSDIDFISHFLLPLLCHSSAKMMGSWLLPGLWVQARGISAWKDWVKVSVTRWDRKGRKKQQLTTACYIQAPRSQCHSWQECRTQRSHTHIKPCFDLNPHHRDFNSSRHCQCELLCFPLTGQHTESYKCTTPSGRHRVINTPSLWRTCSWPANNL